jgi:hypothetical protein
MVYGAEAVLPTDIAFRSPHVENFDEDRSDEARELEVNCFEERRLDSCVRTAKYLAVLRRYYNKNVKERLFVVGDLVLKWKTNQEHLEGNIFLFSLSTIHSSDNLLSPITMVVGCIISWLDACSSCSDGVLTDQRHQELKPHCSEKVKTACRIIMYSAQGLAVGVLTPIPLQLDLG